eukprot:TRINITY_DN13077_c0_g1_i3.p2 TRINITY_DN13077_c0_g1~~TRINITY_DN13077_c0_g1_i3.p2  ORF type:complete len:433 (+),score=-64.83 TRINITY_DN13077_c0_g1_i3:2653-3951(+)
MSLAIVYSRAVIGLSAPIVRIEVHIFRGLPHFSLVGLPEKVVKESKDRVRSAIINSGFDFPMRRILVNLAPAELPKEGGRFDLAIAIGVLIASGQLAQGAAAKKLEFAGELSLSGAVCAVSGMLIFAAATEKAKSILFFPEADKAIVQRLSTLEAYPVPSLRTVVSHLRGDARIEAMYAVAEKKSKPYKKDCSDFSSIKGQNIAKRALEIAAAGQHSVLLNGPPGVGKSLLARGLPSLLPPLTEEETLELALLQGASSSHAASFDHEVERPFRAPHHSVSSHGLIGGGSPPQPGEISLAHLGVLFLDELTEFSKGTLENLREPLEVGAVTIARLGYNVTFPAKCLLIAAMNPCPCGYFSEIGNTRCTCSSSQLQRYHAKLSGPLLERIDLHVFVRPLSTACLTQADYVAESSAEIAKRVKKARAFSHRQKKR